MPIWTQLILFGIPGFFLYYGVYYGTPALIKRGIPLIYSFWFCLWMPVFNLLPLSLILYWRDGGTLSMEAIRERFRLSPIEGYDWLWVFGAVLLTVVFDQVLEPIGKFLARYRMFSPPTYLPAPFNPLKKMSFPPEEFFGVPLKGNWGLLAIFFPLHLIAMISEDDVARLHSPLAGDYVRPMGMVDKRIALGLGGPCRIKVAFCRNDSRYADCALDRPAYRINMGLVCRPCDWQFPALVSPAVRNT